MGIGWEVAIILALIFANGLFAAAEIAILTVRRTRLEQQERLGDRRARLALELASDPARFFSTVQVGVTLVGTVAAVFGGYTIAEQLAEQLAMVPWAWVVDYRGPISVGIVVLGITLLSLVLGELVPKRLALANAERWARRLALPMYWTARLGRPLVWVVHIVSSVVLRLLGCREQERSGVSLDDIEHLLVTGRSEGVLEPAEQMVATRALRLGDRTVKEIMRPRIEIDALDVDTPPDEVIGAVAMAGFSRLPVHEGDLDHIIGFVYTKDLLRQQHMGWPIEIRKLVRPALLAPATLRLDKLLEEFRSKRTQMAIVLDEFGGTQGLVTMEDVLEELVGEIHDEHREERQQEIVRRDERSWLVDGLLGIDSFLAAAGLDDLRTALPRGCTTLGGLVTTQLDRIARLGDRVEWRGLQLEVVDMHGPRIDRILVTLP